MFDFWISTPIKEEKAGALQKLKSLVGATCLRRTKDSCDLALNLPSRTEKTELVSLHGDDQELYDFFKGKTTRIAVGMDQGKGSTAQSGDREKGNILSLMNILRFICNHGKEMLPAAALNVCKQTPNAYIDWKLVQDTNTACGMCGQDLEETTQISQVLCASCIVLSDDTSQDFGTGRSQQHGDITDGKRSKSDSRTRASRPSAKVEALITNLKTEQAINCESVPVKRYFVTWRSKI